MFSALPFERKLILLLAFLAVAAVSMTLAGLDAIDFVRQSECRTAVVAREMLNSGDFLVPTVNRRPRFEKPPLYYWAIAALAGKTGGVTEAVARLPSVLAALATALALGGFAWRRARLLNQSPAMAAWLAAALLIGLPGFWQRATLADAESMLALTCLVITVCLYWHLRQARRNLLLGAYALSAVAFLVKGPIFLFFTWPAYLWLARSQLKKQARWHGLGLVLFLAGAISWYAAVLWLEPHALEVFRRELAMRFDSQEATHPQPLWFYLSQLFESTLPLGLFVPAALYAAWRRRGDKAEAFLLGNGALAFIALTILKTKQAHYLMPLLPWLALWLGDLAWSASGRWQRWAVYGWLGLGGLLTAALGVLAYAYGAIWLMPIFALLAVAAMIAIRRLGDYPLRTALLWTLALTVGGYAANEAVLKPLRSLKFEHSAYFDALRKLAATQGLAVTFDDACFYYNYALPVMRATTPPAPEVAYVLTDNGAAAGVLRNHHRDRLEWLWGQWKSEAVSQPLLSVSGGELKPAETLTKQAGQSAPCLSADLWSSTEAAVLKITMNSACSMQVLLPDLRSSNDLLQSRLAPWKLLWLEARDLPPPGLQRWLLQHTLSRWAETSDAAVVLDKTGLLSKHGKHGAPLLLTPGESDDIRITVNGDVLQLTGPDGTARHWQRQADGAQLNMQAKP